MTATTTENAIQSQAETLFEPADIVEVRCIQRGKGGGPSQWVTAAELPTLADWIAEQERAGVEVYIGVGPRTNRGGKTDLDVSFVRCIFADFDDCDPDEAATSWESAGMPEPSLLLDSGHGVHAYWRLQKPLESAEFRAVQVSLAKLLNSDSAVQNPSRVMRIVGGLNLKNPEDPVRCRLVIARPDLRYSINEIKAIIPSVDVAEPLQKSPLNDGDDADLEAFAKAADLVSRTAGAIEGEGGNAATFQLACKLRRDRGLSHNQTMMLMEAWNQDRCRPPWSASELETIVRNAEQYGENDPPSSEPMPDPPKPAWLNIGEVMRAEAYKGGVKSVSTGFEALDRLLVGGFRTGVSIIAGRTGSAKSTLMGNVARLSALAGRSVLFLTLEDSAIIAAWRLHAASANVTMTTMLEGIASQDGPGINALRDSFRLVASLPIRLSEVRDVSEIERLIRHHANDGGEVVLLDQVSKVNTPDLSGNASTFERVSLISERLRMVANDTGLPIVVASQVNREASKTSRDLEVNDLRDSGMLEQDAAAVLLVNKPTDVATTPGQPSSFAKSLPVQLGKHRFGPAGGKADLIWYPRIARIDDPVEGASR
jgi:hypothetical protein